MSKYPSYDTIAMWHEEAKTPIAWTIDIIAHVAHRAVDWARANPAPQEPPTDQHFDCPCGGFSLYHAHGWAWMPQEPPAEPTEAMRHLARRAVAARAADHRTDAEVVADGVSFVMYGPGSEPTEAPKATSGRRIDEPITGHRGHCAVFRKRGSFLCEACVEQGHFRPPPTSGDKPPHEPSDFWHGDIKINVDPRNPSPTPEPATAKERLALLRLWPQRTRVAVTPEHSPEVLAAVAELDPEAEPSDPWALPDGWTWAVDRGEWVVQTPRGWWWRGTDRPADGDDATQAICDLIALRNRADPPKGDE